MKKTLFFTSTSLFFAALLFLFASCNSNDTGAAKTDASPAAANTAATAVTPQAALLSGNLDTLWMTAAAFNNLGPGTRITFIFYDTLDAFTLRGWTGNPNSWNNNPPNVRLLKGRQSPVMYGSGSYFGALQLSPNNYNTIRQKLTATDATYVLFGPVNPTTSPGAGQIDYNIFVTSDDPANVSPEFKYKFVVNPTGVSTNPSPPRNGN
jgi:hypothetical protein